MKDAILVRGSWKFSEYGFAYLFASLGMIATLIAIAVNQEWIAAMFGLVPLGCAFAVAWDVARKIRSRRWVRDLGDGIMIIDRDDKFEVMDNDFLAMALIHKDRYSQGKLQFQFRRFIVWAKAADSIPVRIEMSNAIAPGSTDPLMTMIERISELLFQRAQNDLRSGQPALGERWTIHNGVLTVRGKLEEKTCPLTEVIAIDTVDSDVCIWRVGQADPYLRVPKDTANAYVLWRLVADHLAHHPPNNALHDEVGLGRLIFERGAKKAEKVAFAFLTGAFVVSGISLSFYLPSMICPGVSFFCAAACGLTAMYMLQTRFRCYARGIYKAGIFGTRTLEYEDVRTFSYAAVRTFSHGVYVGTHFRLCFEPVAELGLKRVRHAFTIENADDELDTLRDRFATLISSRMNQQLSAGAKVEWTQQLAILPEGIVRRYSGLLALRAFGKSEFIPFSDISSYSIHQGFFFLWRQGHAKPVLKEDTSHSNFFPGYYVLASILPSALAQPG